MNTKRINSMLFSLASDVRSIEHRRFQGVPISAEESQFMIELWGNLLKKNDCKMTREHIALLLNLTENQR